MQKALSFLPWVGSNDKQNVTEPVQEQQQEQPSKQDTAMPSDYMALLFVSLLWGSYAPALRYLYNTDELLTPQVRLDVAYARVQTYTHNTVFFLPLHHNQRLAQVGP